MFVIDYLAETIGKFVEVSPFHTGHIGLIPNTKATATLLQSNNHTEGCEICITPYQQSLRQLFRLKCILKEGKGVVNRLLRAIAALEINILSLECATLESKNGHGVYMLLDWGTSHTPVQVQMPGNVSNIFFPKLSGIIPPHDLRYLVLLRQIMGQCADVMLWTSNPTTNEALPRLYISEFDEHRNEACRGQVEIKSSHGFSQKIALSWVEKLRQTGVTINLDDAVNAQTRIATARDDKGIPLHYILLSDIESKTLRIFVPRRGRERRMIHVGFSHKNKPGALCEITSLIKDNKLSIVSGLVRKQTDERNILEATLEHETDDLPASDLVRDPIAWVQQRLDIKGRVDSLRYYEVHLESPMYPKKRRFQATPLYPENTHLLEEYFVITRESAEKDVANMRKRMHSAPDTRWLIELLFAPEWGPTGKPSLFLSYPKSGAIQARAIMQALSNSFHIIELQEGNTKQGRGVTAESLERIKQSQYFIGIWHHEEEDKNSLSPWMPFEYGAAMSNNKPYIILQHENLPVAYKHRIDMDIARIEYRDLNQQANKVDEVKRRTEEWLALHRRLTL